MVCHGMEASEKEVIGETGTRTTTAEKDGSVVSGVTDPASLEGTRDDLALQSSMDSQEKGVPKQVVLDTPSLEGEESPDKPSPARPPAGTTPTKKGASSDKEKAERPSDERVEKALNEELSDYDNVEEYIQSEEGQNAIVERSPGSRYVRFKEKLGSGASKDVYRAYDTQEGIEVAWNVVSLKSVPTKAERNRIINEVRLLERLHHENIISFHGSWVNREKQEVIFVTEILSSGTLKSFINKVQVIRWKIAKRWAVQILRGLAYLHSQDPPVIHRDLKCENIFINGTSGDLRIGDLGLSTVHQNGRQLSVLGTPEFMAPDMYYQDKSYDEKVDVYAFGMCLLEIFTKEIPYSECSNPAQIYNKVMAGEPPEVLSRLQSRHARDFVELCLGSRDEEGNFVRPTVEELLQHDFLVKRANDDDEVLVSKPMRTQAIPETHSITIPPRNKKQDPPLKPMTESAPATAKASKPAENDDDDNDQFEEMQESEILMRKVKVMMGREKQLEEDEEVEAVNEDEGETVLTSEKTVDSVISAPVDGVTTSSFTPAESVVTAPARVQSGSDKTSRPFPLKAYVIENQNAQQDGNTLKLIVALPVDGQTQNVEFDFDLIADDPVQVAKEMVQELSISTDTVLEISEMISGVARSARVKHEKKIMRMQNQQYQKNNGQSGHVQGEQQYQGQRSVSRFNVGQHDHPQFQQQALPPMPHYAVPGNMAMQDQHQYQQYQLGSQQHMGQHQHGSHQHVVQQHANQLQHGSQPQQQGGQIQLGGQPQHGQGQSNNGGLANHQRNIGQPNNGGHSNHQLNAHQHNGQNLNVQPSFAGNYQGPPPNHPLPQLQQQQGQFHTPGQGGGFGGHMSNQDLAQHHQIQQQKHASQQQNRGTPNLVQPGQYQPSNGASFQNGAHANEGMIQNQSSYQTSSTPPQTHQFPSSSSTVSRAQTNLNTVDGHHGMTVNAPTNPTSNLSAPQAQTQYPPPAPPQARRVNSEANDSATVNTPNQSQPQAPSTLPRSDSGTASIVLESGDATDDGDSDVDEGVLEQLRKLDEDFAKKMQNTRKVFDTRMDNIQRSQDEKESLHRLTLEKHERERAEYEKRRAEEEKKQQERLVKIQREWDLKRETLTKQKKLMKNGQNNSPGVESGHDSQVTSDLTHTRTLSSTSSIPSVSPAVISHKVPHDPGGQEAADKER